MSEKSPLCNFGWKAPNFNLFSTNEENINLREFTIKPNFSGFLVMFICNHCPYVNAIIKKIVRDCKDLEKLGVHSLAICSNDSLMYPEDSYEKMKSYSKDNNFSFPYLHDPDQKIAKLYGAICTPDFFGFNQNSLLQYRGRLDGSGKNPTTDNLDRDLYNAMKQISQTGEGPKNQHTSIGCSIKWRQNRGG